MKHSPEELLELARRAGRAAAKLVQAERPAGRVPVAGTKTSPTDVVTAIDRSSEQLIRQIILGERPQDGFLGEEDGATDHGGPIQWIVDPIDGTVNFLYGLPQYAVCIAAAVDGVVVAGYVADVASGEEYEATLGGGAWLSHAGERTALTGPPAAEVSGLLVATGFSYDSDRRAAQGAAVAKLLPQVRDIRRRGSAALDLVAVARGWVDAYVEQGLNPWDWAAAGLIATESGAVLSGLDGAAPGNRLVAAAHRDVAQEFFELVTHCGF